MNWIMVFIGGGVGAVARYGLSFVFGRTESTFPWATLVANIVACLFIGVLFSFNLKEMNKMLWLLLAVGFCGGLSTFSAFSLETVQLFSQEAYTSALLNIVISIIGCLLCTYSIAKLIG